MSTSATGRSPQPRGTLESISVRELGTADMGAASDLLAGIWQRSSGSPMDTAMLVALAHAGNYVAGAFDEQRLVGVCVGFFAAPVGEVLHSHIAGVARDESGRGIGSALKQHQWEWCQERGLSAITWTFDPLVARNAYFNFHRLGVEVERYVVDFYGTLQDGVNGGQDSDRLLVRWPTSTRPAMAGAAAPGGQVHVVLDRDEAGRPVAGEQPGPDDAWCSVALATDVELLRRADPGLAREWRLRLREVLPRLLDDGWRIADVDRAGHYLMRRA